jgi:hypothetical protein
VEASISGFEELLSRAKQPASQSICKLPSRKVSWPEDGKRQFAPSNSPVVGCPKSIAPEQPSGNRIGHLKRALPSALQGKSADVLELNFGAVSQPWEQHRQENQLCRDRE